MTEYIFYTLDKIYKLFDYVFLKFLFSCVALVSSFLFGNLYNEGLIAIAMLMIFDTILGIMAVYREGDAITSRGFSRVVVKGFVYFSAISAGYFADLTIPFNVIQATMISFVGITEFISILENIGRLGYQTPKKLLNQLKAYRDSGGIK